MTAKKIEWLFPSAPISNSEIQDVEKELGIKFPRDYVECVAINNGGSPNINTFDFLEHKGAVLSGLLSYHENESNYILDAYGDIKDRLINGIYPFAEDPFGNFICFSYRESNRNPTIVFWDHDIAAELPPKAISLICDTFTELLNRLY